jgi:hypothetical protein
MVGLVFFCLFVRGAYSIVYTSSRVPMQSKSASGSATPVTLCAVRLLGELARFDGREIVAKQQTEEFLLVCAPGHCGVI